MAVIWAAFPSVFCQWLVHRSSLTSAYWLSQSEAFGCRPVCLGRSWPCLSCLLLFLHLTLSLVEH